MWIYSIVLEHKFRRGFCSQKVGIKRSFKDYWYTKINLTQIWYDKFNWKAWKVTNSLHTQQEFLIIINYIRQTKSESKIYIMYIIQSIFFIKQGHFFQKSIRLLNLKVIVGFKRVNFKSVQFCTTIVYFLPFFSSILKKEGRRKGDWSKTVVKPFFLGYIWILPSKGNMYLNDILTLLFP